MARKVLMLGMDALMPTLLERFVEEGILPNFGRLFREGCFCRLRPVIPAQTPSNWQTIATGATPGTHSVVVWGAHRPGDPAPECHRAEAFSSGICLAEYIWEAAARKGKGSVVMNYAGYPPTSEKATFLDRIYRPARSYYDVALPTVYHTLNVDAGDHITFSKAEGWTSLPDSHLPPLEAEVRVEPSSEGEGPAYRALLWAEGKGYDTMALCRGRDIGTSLFRLKVGDWSGWVREMFRTEEMGEVEAAFRLKLVECSPDGNRIRIYRSEAFPTDGRFCSDPELGRRLVEELGPYVHAMMTVALHVREGILDWETVDQALSDEATWWSEAARLAMEETGAELLYLHWHLPDLVEHRLVPLVDPTGTEYSPERAQDAWEELRRYYRAMDGFLGEFLRWVDLSRDVVAVASDHGMPANRKAASLVNAFRDKGWLTFTPDGRAVDWGRSKVFFEQNHLWINLKGREPTGVVPPEEYTSLRAEVQRFMRDLKDPETGEHVFAFVLTREEAPVVGLWGEHIGDLVFCYSGGYRWSGDEVLRMGEERVVFPCGGGNHGPMVPTYETGVGSNYGVLILAGAGVRKGVVEEPSRRGSRCTTDVAPTLAYLLGIGPPAQSEGRVLHEFLEGFRAEGPRRKLVPLERNVRQQRKPKAPQLKGDVTDEER